MVLSDLVFAVEYSAKFNLMIFRYFQLPGCLKDDLPREQITSIGPGENVDESGFDSSSVELSLMMLLFLVGF